MDKTLYKVTNFDESCSFVIAESKKEAWQLAGNKAADFNKHTLHTPVLALCLCSDIITVKSGE